MNANAVDSAGTGRIYRNNLIDRAATAATPAYFFAGSAFGVSVLAGM